MTRASVLDDLLDLVGLVLHLRLAVELGERRRHPRPPRRPPSVSRPPGPRCARRRGPRGLPGRTVLAPVRRLPDAHHDHPLQALQRCREDRDRMTTDLPPRAVCGACEAALDRADRPCPSCARAAVADRQRRLKARATRLARQRAVGRPTDLSGI
jgi:hypothetical protein